MTDISPDVLDEEDGQWVQCGATKVWQVRPRPAVSNGVPHIPAPAQSLDVSKLIACPTCHAKVTERCKSAGGIGRSPHVNRLAPRLCPCGELLGGRKQLCEWCRREARAATYADREKRVPTRLRRKAA